MNVLKNKDFWWTFGRGFVIGIVYLSGFSLTGIVRNLILVWFKGLVVTDPELYPAQENFYLFASILLHIFFLGLTFWLCKIVLTKLGFFTLSSDSSKKQTIDAPTSLGCTLGYYFWSLIGIPINLWFIG